MKVNRIKIDGDLVFSAPQAKQKIREAALEKNVELDFDGVEYIDSVGVGLVLDLVQKQKEKSGTVKLINVKKTVAETLQTAGIDALAEIVIAA